MIEENQQDNYLNQTDNAATSVAEEIGIGSSSSAEVDLSVDSDLEQQISAQPQPGEASADGTSAEELGENREVQAETVLSETGTVEGLRRETETLKEQLEDSQTQCESFKNQYYRIAADFENFRKRTAKEKEELETQVKCATISELLSVVDNFERARSQIKPQTDGEMTIHKSYQSVYKQLVDALKRIGVSPMRPEGKEFDPNLHEAVIRQPTDEHPEGTVLEELVRGYFLGDRVLRHALVKVAAPGEAVVPSDESHPDVTENS